MRLDPALGSEIKKTRPCVVVSDDVINQMRRTVVVIPLSSAPNPHPPILVPVVAGGRHVVGVVDQIRAVTKERLVRRMGSLTIDELNSLERAILEVLGIF